MFPPVFGQVAQLVRAPACHAGGRGFEPLLGRQHASVAQLVEQRTENPRVVGSTPTGGTLCGHSSSGRAPPCQGGGSEFEPRCPLQTNEKEQMICSFSYIWCHSQVVRQGSAKPSFPGSNPGGTSKKEGAPRARFPFWVLTCRDGALDSNTHDPNLQRFPLAKRRFCAYTERCMKNAVERMVPAAHFGRNGQC